jgi:hypothetical protein
MTRATVYACAAFFAVLALNLALIPPARSQAVNVSLTTDTQSVIVKTIRLPGDATTAEDAAMKYAIKQWNDALAGVLEIRVVQGKSDWRVEWALGGLSGAAPEYIPSVSTMAAMHAPTSRGCTAADANSTPGLIRLFVHCMPPGGLVAKMIHETGHMLELGHKPRTAMDEECCFYAQQVDARSAAEARRIWMAKAALTQASERK